MARYRIKLINEFTKETQITMMGFNNKNEAIDWATKWRASGDEFNCEILDTKKDFEKVEF